MSNMIERVAGAIKICDAFPLGDTREYLLQTDAITIARAAIAAMRDCTPEMLDAGSAAHPAGGYKRSTLLNDIIECEWRAMVDAALEEK
jgi:hypothetical protein